MNIKVNIHWDEEAEVWVAVCDTLGIVLESGSYDALIEKIKNAVPEMIELNKIEGVETIEVLTKNRQMAYA
jgi:predicted RNase H-like HicB family nuclease